MINKDKTKYVLTVHGAQRLQGRGIKKGELEKVLNDPDYIYSGKQGELNLVKEISKGKKIRIVAKVEKEKIKIITAIISD
jgi:hypothetical protein